MTTTVRYWVTPPRPAGTFDVIRETWSIDQRGNKDGDTYVVATFGCETDALEYCHLLGQTRDPV